MFGLDPDTERNIKQAFAEIPVIDKVILYGSRAKGNYRNGSDIDITLFGDKLTLSNSVYPLTDGLEDLNLPYMFDISIFSHIDNEDLIEHIHRAGKVLYLKEKGLPKGDALSLPKGDALSLPKGWEVKKLGEVCDVINGGTPKTGNTEYWSGNIKWLTPKDMGKLANKYVDDTSKKITTLGLQKSSAKLIPANSVILSTRAPIGHLAINVFEMATNQGCRGIIPGKSISNKYLFYFLSGCVDLLNDLGVGATFKELSTKALSSVQIPLPPLPEQKRIVASLDQAFTAIDQAKANTEKNLKNARELFQSKLQETFDNGKLKIDSGEWEEKKLGEVCLIERGSSPRPIKKYFTSGEDGVNWIKIGDTKGVNKYIYSTRQKITKEGAKKSRHVQAGDFILSNSMSYGKPYIMKTDGYIHDGWFVLRLHHFVDTEYFFQLLSSPYVNNQFHNLASGSVVKNINGDLVKKVILPIPPFAEQKQIVKKLDSVSIETKKLETIYQRKITCLDELKKSILQQAFNGEL